MANLEWAREPLLNYAMLSTRRVNDRLRLCKLHLSIFFRGEAIFLSLTVQTVGNFLRAAVCWISEQLFFPLVADSTETSRGKFPSCLPIQLEKLHHQLPTFIVWDISFACFVHDESRKTCSGPLTSTRRGIAIWNERHLNRDWDSLARNRGKWTTVHYIQSIDLHGRDD